MSDEIEILARTLFGEARGEALSGKVAVAQVILNRARKGGWFGSSIKEVCLKPWQFSCWNKNDPNRKKIEAVDTSHPIFATCLLVADLAVHGLLADETNGADHYFAKSIPEPYWAKGQQAVAEIGGHLFYSLS